MKQIMVRNSLLLALALMLAGCAGLRTPVPPATEPEERQVIQLISYAQRVSTMTAEQQRREYNAGTEAYAREKDAVSRMRLALLLATPGAGFSDAARASSLLEPLATAGEAASPLRALARLVYAQLNERTSEQKRASQLREKLEALKEVERTIMERGQESQSRRR
jgi:hypothetical protein